MVADSLRTRGMYFAFLFGPPRFVTRDEASKIYSSVCDALRTDDFTLKYDTQAKEGQSGRAFNFVLTHPEGRRVFQIQVNSEPTGTQPLRLLLNYEWPNANEDVRERFDIASECAFGALTGPWQKVFAELRIRAQVTAPRRSALGHIQDRLLRLDQAQIDALGATPSDLSIKYSVPPSPVRELDFLTGPAREVSIEVLKQDVSQIYLEVVSRWPQVVPEPGQPGFIDPTKLRRFDEKPSQFIDEGYRFVEEIARKFCQEAPEQELRP